MDYFLGLLLALGSIAVLARPFSRRAQPLLGRGQAAPSSASSLDSLEDVQWRQQQTYDEIKTLILDHELGNIPSDEYEERLGTYRLRAANLLRQQEQFQRQVRYLEDEIEDRVLALRRSWGTVGRVTTCGGCGGEMDINALLCPRCGLSREEESASQGGSPSKEEVS